MDGTRFDRWTRAITRRNVAGLLGLAALLPPGLVAARKKHRKHKHKKKKKVTFNDFGCVNVGDFCKNSSQCCSGICQGKKGKKKCREHNANGCSAGQRTESCGGQNIPCQSSKGDLGFCATTTGNAPYCAVIGECAACKKDADCIADFGPDAACVVCPSCADFGTICVGTFARPV